MIVSSTVSSTSGFVCGFPFDPFLRSYAANHRIISSYSISEEIPATLPFPVRIDEQRTNTFQVPQFSKEITFVQYLQTYF